MREKIQAAFETGQFELGQVDISKIKIDINSRDQIPQILLGLQQLYNDKDILEEAFCILEDEVITKRDVQKNNGRAGMNLWQILVMGILRLNNNWDYDHLENMVNSHQEIRLMLGITSWDKFRFKRKTIINNFKLISAEAFDRISDLVVKVGHRLLEVEDEDLKTRVDSFVVETNVKHPTDSNLLMDAARKIFHVVFWLRSFLNLDIGHSKNELKEIKKLFNKIRKMRHSNSKNDKIKRKREDEIKAAHQVFLEKIQELLNKVQTTFSDLPDYLFNEEVVTQKVSELSGYLDYAVYHIDLITRRVLQGKTISHHEKIFSIFEYYTRWIVKGKAKAPVELGLRVAVMDDQYGFILHSGVMYKSVEEQILESSIDNLTTSQITDEKITLSFTKEATRKHKNIDSVSFDKGFYTPATKACLKETVNELILPKKGKLSEKDKDEQASAYFVEGRQKHAGIESCIHALENHGLDVCPDKGLKAFKRYVSCAILARNLQVLGSHIRKRELARLKAETSRTLKAA